MDILPDCSSFQLMRHSVVMLTGVGTDYSKCNAVTLYLSYLDFRCHSERSEESSILTTSGLGCGKKGLRFFTSLRCVQNDGIEGCVQNDGISEFLYLFCHLPTPVNQLMGKGL